MGFGYDANENIGVDKSTLTDFALTLKGQLQLLTGIIDIPEGLTLKDIRRPSLVIGDPGIGKTDTILSIINELNKVLPPEKQLSMKKIQLGHTVVGELSGIPVIDPSTHRVIRVQSDSLPVAERDGEYGVLFLDEITTADEAQVQPALGLCDDTRNIGTYTLPEHWVVVAAGNGPSCANFIELHDMTLSRFVAFDIQYDYFTDWRPWAHANGINDLIISFLNFKPECVIQVITDESDKCGKQFACPRTWTLLSRELNIRKAVGRPVAANELQRFASGIIGTKAAVDFAAHVEYSRGITVRPEDIMDGKVSKADTSISLQEFHIIVQRLFKQIEKLVKDERNKEDGTYSVKAYTGVGNVVTWILSLQSFNLDATISALVELNKSIDNIADIICDDEDFPSFCPEFPKFMDEYADAILDVVD